VEAARRREPHLILIDIDRSASEIASLAKDLQAQGRIQRLPALSPRPSRAGRPVRRRHGHRAAARACADFLRRPLSATELRAVLDRLFSRQTEAAASAEGRVAAFVSNKGGVGKSTLRSTWRAAWRFGIRTTCC
jgi:Flp pilus assembly CpaE family ATPase